jgi:hypothetical protein
LEDTRAFWTDRAANESALRTSLLSLAATRTRHVGSDPSATTLISGPMNSLFSISPPRPIFKSTCFTTTVRTSKLIPHGRHGVGEKQPRLLVIWGKYDLSFDISEPEAYRRDVPAAQVQVLDAGQFALDTAADEIATLARDFVDSSRATTKGGSHAL